MQFIELRNAFKDFTIFTLSDIKTIDSTFHRRRLTEWQKKGYIKKIIREFYIFSNLEINENVLFEIANKIYSPSYISFEMALSYYHLIPESVYGITSVTTCKTYTFKTQIAQFYYKTIKPELFFGYELIKSGNKYFKIASLEKAILDYFYFNSNIKNISDFTSIRLNQELFLQKIVEEKLYEFLDKFNQKTLYKRINNFIKFIKNA